MASLKNDVVALRPKLQERRRSSIATQLVHFSRAAQKRTVRLFSLKDQAS